MGTVFPRRVAPAQSVPDHEHNSADDAAVIHPRDPVWKRKIALDPAHLRFRKQEQISHGEAFPPRQGISRFRPTQEI
jgi:hypothetical protein